MSKVTWDKMTPDEQALLKKFGREAQFEQRALWDKSVAEYTTKLKTAGVELGERGHCSVLAIAKPPARCPLIQLRRYQR